MKRDISEKRLDFYVIDAEKIASDIGMRGRISMVMQTVFFFLSKILPIETAVSLLKNEAEKRFKNKGFFYYI
jgi:pyruvate-ferredoxin/flavodoxin oxidoreductase